MTIETKTDLVMESLVLYYKEHQNYLREIDNMLNISKTVKNKISLRLLDWFVTNYCKKYIIILPSNDGTWFNVYQQYKLKLKSYAKECFDSCKRKQRIILYYNDSEEFIETTCGQLCFFKWCFENNIIDYIKKNSNEITLDMKESNSKTTLSLEVSSESTCTNETSDVLIDKKRTRKRQTLSDNALRSIVKNDVKYTISYNS